MTDNLVLRINNCYDTDMQQLIKSQWQADGNRITFSMPFAKVDQENRIVSGWATLDNVDTQKDRVKADASTRAFERFRGNIREMHQPIAAGRLIDFQNDSFFHAESNTSYDGIFVRVYVSKGADSTWQKVLDGTLQGFSIGGEIIDASSQYDPELGTTVRVINEYDLVELSLVDSPANPLANVFSVQKSEAGTVIKGMIAEADVENVFMCKDDQIAKAAKAESKNCPICQEPMSIIGWYDVDMNKSDKIAEIVAGFTKQAEEPDLQGGVTKMAVEDNAEGVEEESFPAGEAVSAADVLPDDSANAVEAETVAVEDVDDNITVLSKAIDALNETITKAQEATAGQIADLETKLAKSQEIFGEKVEGLAKDYATLTEKFDSVTSQLESVQKGVEVLEGNTALKKSTDLGGSVEAPKRLGVWGGTIFG